MAFHWLTRELKEISVLWLLLSALVAFATSWATFEFVKRREIAATVRAEIEKEMAHQQLESERERNERVRVRILVMIG